MVTEGMSTEQEFKDAAELVMRCTATINCGCFISCDTRIDAERLYNFAKKYVEAVNNHLK